MLKKCIISHPQFGNIEITRNSRARHIILRARPTHLSITIPIAATQKDLERALDMYGEKLLAQQKSIKSNIIDAKFHIEAPHFCFELQQHNGDKFFLRRNGCRYILLYPADTDFNSESRQVWVREIIKKSLRTCAKEILPQRLYRLATEHGFSYKNVSLRNSHTRWGSCSSRGNISLSIYLMLLPTKLIDYVLLHELCHTVEMNHGERFWALLNKACKCNAQIIRRELKKHKCDI